MSEHKSDTDEACAPPVETMTLDDYDRRVTADKLRMCVDLCVGHQQEVCRAVAKLFKVSYDHVFRSFNLEDLDVLCRQSENSLRNARRVDSDPLEIDTDTLLVEADYIRLCDVVRGRYHQVAGKLRELRAEHGNSLHVGSPEAAVRHEGFFIKIHIYCVTIVL